MNERWNVLGVLVCAVGCGDGDRTTVLAAPATSAASTDPPGSTAVDNDSSLADNAVQQAPYVAALSIQSAAGLQSSYTALLPVLDASADERLRAGLESTGYVTPSAHAGFIYVPGGATPTITKYAVGEDGRLEEAGVVSFGGLGVTNVPKAPVIGADMIAPDKAYYFNRATLQAIAWNPETMELTGTVIELADVLTSDIPEGWTPTVFLNYGDGFARHRDGLLFVPVSWRNWEVADTFYPSAGLLVIDTKTDSVVHLLQDERLADSIYTVVTASNDLYLFNGGLGVAHHRVRGTAAAGAALRVRSGEDSFDPEYFLALDAAVGDRPATTPAYAGGSSVYVRAFEEAEQPITPDIAADPNVLLTTRAWRYWKVDLTGEAPAQQISDLPWTSTDGYFYDTGEPGRRLLGVMEADFSRTTLYEETPSGFVEALSVTGTLNWLSLLARAR